MMIYTNYRNILYGILLSFSGNLYSYNPEHLNTLIKQIENGDIVNCSGFNLDDADLSYLDLKKANFANASLKRANFSNSNLSHALFEKAKLQRTNLSHCDLSKANFTYANMNGANFRYSNLNKANFAQATCKGAKFKGAQLHAVKYEDIYSSKGSLLSDKETLIMNLEEGKKIYDIKSKVLHCKEKNRFVFESESKLNEIYKQLYDILAEKINGNAQYIIADFRPMFESNSIFSNSYDIIQELMGYLNSLFFKKLVKEVIPLFNRKILIIFLNNQSITFNKQDAIPKDSNIKLDLHGKIPLETKYKWIDKFIKESYLKSRGTIEIITGRGLNNPNGKMGIQWRLCKTYLLCDKFKKYISGIQSIGKNGGWRIILKSYSYDRRRSKRDK